MNCSTSLVTTEVLAGKSKAKKRKIAETSNVITETLPSVEGEETVEIEVEVGDMEEASLEEASLEEASLEEASLEEEVDAAARNAQASSDDSALALLADITSKYRPGEMALPGGDADKCPEEAAAAVVEEEELVLQEETVMAPKALESIEVVEVQISQLDNMFRCEKCDRCFKIFYHLKQHMKSHEAVGEGGGGGSKPFVCRHCGKAYAREGALKQHLNSYHYEAEEQSRRQRPQKKVHVCEYCDKQFDHFGHFKEHLRKHTGTSTSVSFLQLSAFDTVDCFALLFFRFFSWILSVDQVLSYLISLFRTIEMDLFLLRVMVCLANMQAEFDQCHCCVQYKNNM